MNIYPVAIPMEQISVYLPGILLAYSAFLLGTFFAFAGFKLLLNRS